MSGVEAVAWMTPEGFEAVKKGPRDGLNGHRAAWARADNVATVPLYSQATVDTLRAQLEATERLVVAVEVQAEENFQRAEAAEAECARRREDAERMDWLVSHSVEVRYPLRHGSRHLFHAQQLNDECDEHETDLRAQIDAARTKEETK